MGKQKFRFCKLRYWLLPAALALSAACSAPPPAPDAASNAGSPGEAALAPPGAMPAPTLRPKPSVTPGVTPIATPTAPTEQTPIVCAPFQGYSQAELLAAISNPFNPPPPGSDDPHQAIDLAIVQDGMALAGAQALAVLAGQVVMVTQDRFPYGNAVLVETRLHQLSAGWLPDDALPTLAPTLPPHPVLTCPAVDAPAAASGERSLYLLYAHLESPSVLQPGDHVVCGAPLGIVGQSGNALNPHLHLEARLGPPGWTFDSMAHYDATASAAEMGAYCLWRVSGLYQLVDPRRILALLP